MNYILCFLFFITFIGQQTYATQYTVTTLPTSSRELSPIKINDQGTVVGEAITFSDDQPDSIGFIWNQERGLQYFSSGKTINIWDINNANQVVGEEQGTAFIWSPENGFERFATKDFNTAVSINNCGEILVWSGLSDEILPDSQNFHLRTPDGVIKPLDIESDPKKILLPFDMNDHGQVLISKFNFEFSGRGFILTQPNRPTKTFAGNLFGIAVNNQGDVLAVKETKDTVLGLIYTAKGTKKRILHEQFVVMPAAFNDSLEVVGNYSYEDKDQDVEESDEKAFVWTPEEEFRDLTGLVIGETNLVIKEAISINNRGQILALAESENGTVSVVLTPTEVVAKIHLGPNLRSDFSQIAYSQQDMSICEKPNRRQNHQIWSPKRILQLPLPTNYTAHE